MRALVMALPTYNLPTIKPGVFTAPTEPWSRMAGGGGWRAPSSQLGFRTFGCSKRTSAV